MGISIGIDAPILIGSALTLLAVLASAGVVRLPGLFQVPGALLFLGIGMLVGSDGIGLVDVSLDELGAVQNVAVVALLLILYEGGLTTKPTDLRLAALPGTLLATLGVLITAGVTGLGVWLVLDVEPSTAALIAAVVASTDAAAVFAMMRSTPLPRRVSALLRVESGANDPIAVMLTVGLIATAEGAVGVSDWVTFAAVQLFGGALLGAAVGIGGTAVLRRVQLGIEGLYPVLATVLAGLAYGVAVAVGASGFVAVYVAGLLVGARLPRHRRSILGVQEALAHAAEIGLFLILGLLVAPSELPGVILPALAVAAILTLVARPVAVWLCSFGSGQSRGERTLVSWAGLRGAVPIVLATFPVSAGLPEGGTIFNVVFFVVLVSVLVQGLTLLPLVRWLGLGDDRPAWAPVAEALPIDGADVDVIELEVSEGLALAGRRLREMPAPAATLVAALVREGVVLIPQGSTRVRAGDRLLLTAQRQEDVDLAARVTAWARGELGARTTTPGEPYAEA